MEQQLSQMDLRAHLQNELSRRCRANSRYSIRAFARYLKMDASTVAKILTGRRGISAKMKSRLCAKVGLPNGVSRESVVKRLSQDTFAAIADWYHYAILDLTQLASFKNDPRWIARKLGISPLEAQNAIERLLRLELLVERDDRLLKSEPNYENCGEGQSSEAYKEYQRQVIRKALMAIDDCPPKRKDMTGMTIAANSAKLHEAKLRIWRFRRQLAEFLEDGHADSVFHLSIQLFPLTRDESETS